METVGFTQMAAGTKEDYLLLERLEKAHVAGVAGRVLQHLLELNFLDQAVTSMAVSAQNPCYRRPASGAFV